jgi:hypothetical protein
MMLFRKFQEFYAPEGTRCCTYLSEKALGYDLRGMRGFHATRWIYLLLVTK